MHSSFYIKIHDSLYFPCLISLLNHNRALIPTVTTPIFHIQFRDTLEIFLAIFLYIYIYIYIQVPPKFQQSLLYTGRSQVMDINPVYTSNNSHLITQNHDPNHPGSQPNSLSTTQNILFNNIVQCSSNERFNSI